MNEQIVSDWNEADTQQAGAEEKIWPQKPEDIPNLVDDAELDIDISDILGDIESAGESITYRRVQGGSGNNASHQRISVNPDGSISISNKDWNLSVSIDNGEHSTYFRNNVRGNENTHVV